MTSAGKSRFQFSPVAQAFSACLGVVVAVGSYGWVRMWREDQCQLPTIVTIASGVTALVWVAMAGILLSIPPEDMEDPVCPFEANACYCAPIIIAAALLGGAVGAS